MHLSMRKNRYDEQFSPIKSSFNIVATSFTTVHHHKKTPPKKKRRFFSCYPDLSYSSRYFLKVTSPIITTAANTNNAYRLGFTSGEVTPVKYYNKWDAFAIRCIVK